MASAVSRRDFLKLTPIALALLLELKYPELGKALCASRLEEPLSEARPNILVLVFDSLSAGHMSLFGYPRRTTPNIDRFSQRCVVYHSHYAAGSFTTPGTASLLTGAYPWSHRAFNLASIPLKAFRARNLFAAFTAHGYHCLAYTHNRLANYLLKEFRQDIPGYIPRRSFLSADRQLLGYLFPDDNRVASMTEEVVFTRKKKSSLFLSILDQLLAGSLVQNGEPQDFPRGLPEVFRASFVLEDSMNGIQASLSVAPQPFLGYFHLMPPHEPYRTREEFKDIFSDGRSPPAKAPHFFSQGETNNHLSLLRRSYDEYLAYADAEFGRLVDNLEGAGLLQNTVVVLTSDHGQMFERGIHGHITPVLFDPLIHVPLLIYRPNNPVREDVYSLTSCVDLLPTLASITGREIPEWCEGVVLPPFSGDPVDPGRSIYVIEAKRNGQNKPFSIGTAAILKDGLKLVSYFGYRGYSGIQELYDTRADPAELRDLTRSARPLASDMLAELQGMLHRHDEQYYT
jgi:arylsulfatase A-like enzyme